MDLPLPVHCKLLKKFHSHDVNSPTRLTFDAPALCNSRYFPGVILLVIAKAFELGFFKIIYRFRYISAILPMNKHRSLPARKPRLLVKGFQRYQFEQGEKVTTNLSNM